MLGSLRISASDCRVKEIAVVLNIRNYSPPEADRTLAEAATEESCSWTPTSLGRALTGRREGLRFRGLETILGLDLQLWRDRIAQDADPLDFELHKIARL